MPNPTGFCGHSSIDGEIRESFKLSGTFTAFILRDSEIIIGGTANDCSAFHFKVLDFDLNEISAFQVKATKLGCLLPSVSNLTPTIDGGFVFTPGPTFRLLKIDPNFNLEWDFPYWGKPPAGQTISDVLGALISTKDGGFLLAGTSNTSQGQARTALSHGGFDIWILKISPEGSVEWDRSYGGGWHESFSSIAPSIEGGYLISGISHSEQPSGNKDIAGKGYWFLKINDRGIIQDQFLIPSPNLSYKPELVNTNIGIKAIFNSSPPTISDISVFQSIIINAHSDGMLFGIDFSSDLSQWTGLVKGFSGAMQFQEPVNSPQKFWRIYTE
ncbi:MAG TPA: hypothetical protein EYQ50_23355 [Verrucomicrobiales bacterium]|nr:hypothetical protein [Verrucomicrobiales bacterium]